jgi:hypothetical protein
MIRRTYSMTYLGIFLSIAALLLIALSAYFINFMPYKNHWLKVFRCGAYTMYFGFVFILLSKFPAANFSSGLLIFIFSTITPIIFILPFEVYAKYVWEKHMKTNYPYWTFITKRL